MIGMKDQCFGVEVEMTGITVSRRQQRWPRILQRTPAMWAALTINGV